MQKPNMPANAMFSQKLLALFLLSLTLQTTSLSTELGFTFAGFKPADVALDGIAEITPNGLLRLTNNTKQQKGHAYYPHPVTFKASQDAAVSSFSAAFVFAIHSEYATLSGHGIAFVISPSCGLPSQYLGLFSGTNNGNATNHIAAVELDTIQSNVFVDINDNHVGVDINGLKSEAAAPAGYYDDKSGALRNLITLISGRPMKMWTEYDGVSKRIDVTLAPVNLDSRRNRLCLWFGISLGFYVKPC